MKAYFFYGDEEFLIEREINSMREKLLDKNFSTMNYKTISNPSYADFISILRTQPMMFGNQMIVINIEKYFTQTFEDKEINEMSKALDNIADSLYIIFVYNLPRNENKKLDSRRRIYKLLMQKTATTEFASIKSYNIDALSKFINSEAKKNGVTMEVKAVQRLIEQVGNNLRDLSKEIEKLVLAAYPQKKITEKNVKEICITNEDLFAFSDILFKGQKAQALKEFRKLCDKKHPLEIISALQTMLRKTIITKLNEKKLSTFDIAKLTNQNEFVVKKTLEKFKNTPLTDLVKLKRNIANAEYNIKSGLSLSVNEEIEYAFLK